MTVQELIEQLQSYNPEATVYFMNDNGYQLSIKWTDYDDDTDTVDIGH